MFGAEVEGDPARAIAELDVGDLYGRHRRGIEHVHIVIDSIRQPNTFSSGLSAMLWLGQPWPRACPEAYPLTCTANNSLPVWRSPISNPSSWLTLTQHSELLPFTVKGRITSENGPTLCTT